MDDLVEVLAGYPAPAMSSGHPRRPPRMMDLRPAAEGLATLVQGVNDDQLDAPTPCASRALGALLDHVDGLSLAFALAARKQEPEGGSRPPSADGARLTPDWRSRIPTRLAAMAEAWRAPEAWTGVTRVGGVDLPGDVAALVAIDELVVHGWDIAVSSGQPMETDPALVAAATSWVEASVARNPRGVPGLFGPPVPVTTSSSPLEQLVALTGRDPVWRPAAEWPSLGRISADRDPIPRATKSAKQGGPLRGGPGTAMNSESGSATPMWPRPG